MASISKTPSGTYAVSYRVNGKQTKRTFKDKKLALRFRDVVDMDPSVKSTRVTVGELMLAYRDKMSAKKRGARAEGLRLTALARRTFASIRLDKVTHRDLQAFVDERTTEVAPATVVREVATLSAVFAWAKSQDLILESPTRGLVLPRPPEHRERVASDEDIEKLLAASGWDGKSPPCNNMQTVIAAFLFSCRTGMRAGEILQLEVSWIDGCVIHLPASATKTATRRDVALGKDALRLLALVKEANGNDLFQMRSGLRDALFRKVRDRAGLGPVLDSHGNVIKEGLHFHDGRATFATWAASPDPETGAPRLDVMALSRQTGHRDLKMLMRYYRATAQEIAKRLK
jgi:putative integrase/recombinase